MVTSISLVFLIVADFNMTVHELSDSGWLNLLQVEAALPLDTDHTCKMGSGRLIDFLLPAKELRAGILSVTTDRAVPWSPHYGIGYTLNAQPITIWRRVLEAALGHPGTPRTAHRALRCGSMIRKAQF